MSEKFSHVPVLLDEVIKNLNIKPNGRYLDGTVGGAGHSLEIIKRLKTGTLYCLDKDPDAIVAATERLKKYKNIVIKEGDFRETKSIFENTTFDGVLLDLGVSSHQLDVDERGFSYSKDNLLDMRMSKSGISAKDIVNTYTETELSNIIHDYGEERYSRYIAKKIVAERQLKTIERTVQLAEIVVSALPPDVRRKEKNPARKTFMALRIETNDEFEALKEGIDSIFDMLNSNGMFLVISFHSLEDKILKQKFNDLAKGCECPPDFPICVCGKTPKAKIVTRKPIVASETEIESNRRSRSAKLRVLQKI